MFCFSVSDVYGGSGSGFGYLGASMKAWGFDRVCWLVTSCLRFLLILLFYSCSWGFSGGSHGFVGFVTPYLCLDGVGFYLLVLTVVISFCLIGLGS